jgi:hypothetical protein
MNALYLLQTAKSITNSENVFKIGKTTINLRRFKSPEYKGCSLIAFLPCKNCHSLEKIAIDEFKQRFKWRKDYGNEYFEGDKDEMYKYITDICRNENTDEYLSEEKELDKEEISNYTDSDNNLDGMLHDLTLQYEEGEIMDYTAIELIDKDGLIDLISKSKYKQLTREEQEMIKKYTFHTHFKIEADTSGEGLIWLWEKWHDQTFESNIKQFCKLKKSVEELAYEIHMKHTATNLLLIKNCYDILTSKVELMPSAILKREDIPMLKDLLLPELEKIGIKQRKTGKGERTDIILPTIRTINSFISPYFLKLEAEDMKRKQVNGKREIVSGYKVVLDDEIKEVFPNGLPFY